MDEDEPRRARPDCLLEASKRRVEVPHSRIAHREHFGSEVVLPSLLFEPLEDRVCFVLLTHGRQCTDQVCIIRADAGRQ